MIVTIINHFYKNISATGILFLKIKRLLVEVMNFKKIKLCSYSGSFYLAPVTDQKINDPDFFISK